MISSQYGTEFKRSEYGKLKKVYSIWICNNSPKYKRNTITSYHMTKDMLVGYIRKEKESYDLMHVIRICLGEPAEAERGSVLRLLDTLFSPDISADDKKRLLVDEFHIELEDSLERKVEDVCTFSEGVEYRAKKRGAREGRKIGMKLGKELGEKTGFVKAMRAMNASTEEITKQLVMQLGVSEQEACELVQG